jgi:hypothetical protein
MYLSCGGETMDLVSGIGQYHTNEVGAKNRSPYLSIDWDGIKALVDNPQEVPKDKAKWLIPSSYPSRNFAKQELLGEYHLMWADLDKNTLSIQSIADIVEGIFQADFEVYTSRSATPDLIKCRILVPLLKPLCCSDWMLSQKIFNAKLQELSIEPDTAAERSAQLCYLPNRGGYYDKDNWRAGEFFKPLVVWAEEIEIERVKLQKARMELEELSANRCATVRAGTGLIQAFNDSFTPHDILIKAGYSQRGNTFCHPESAGGSYSANVRLNEFGVLRVNTLSTSDPLWLEGSNSAHDSFSCFTVLVHNGDINKALKDAGDNQIFIGGVPFNTYHKPQWAQELDKVIENFNLEYAVVLNGSKAVVMKTHLNSEGRNERVYMQTDSFTRLHMNKKLKVGEAKNGSDVYKTSGQAFLEHPNRKQYIDGVVFEPSSYLGGIEKTAIVYGNKLNLWQGYGVEAIDGSCNAIHEHIKAVICDGDEIAYQYLLNWIARGLQTPAENGQVAVALRGNKGSGKSTLGKLLIKLYGGHGLQIADNRFLIGNFNAHMQDCCFLFADEAFFAGNPAHENVLKGIITEPTIMIERKGIDAVVMKNRLKILMSSNSDWVTPATADERRYFVLDVPNTKIGEAKYFKALHQAIEDPLIAGAFLNEMLHRDLSTFNVSEVPETSGLKAQRLQSLESFPEFWVGVLKQGFITNRQGCDLPWQSEVSFKDINEGYSAWVHANKVNTYNIANSLKIGKYLTSWYPKKRLSAPKLSIGTEAVARPKGYVVGTLEEAIGRFCDKQHLDKSVFMD